MNKPIALFATPRSGSSPVCDLIGYYLQVTAGTENHLELLNSDIHDPKVSSWSEVEEKRNQGFIKSVLYTKFPHLKAENFAEHWEYLQKNYQKVFFKFFPYHVKPEHTDWISQHYRVITLERDLFDQHLSYQVSRLTGIHYSRDGIHLSDASVTAKFEFFKDFLNDITQFRQLKAKYQWTDVVTYEEFMSLDRVVFLKKIGLTESIDWKEFSPIWTVQNGPGIERKFTNMEEIKSWFDQNPFPK